MYIGGNYKTHKVEFGYIDIGVPFYAYDYERNKNILYMKIDEAFFRYHKRITIQNGYLMSKTCNAVSLDNGELTFFKDDDNVVIAQVHIEENKI